MRKSLLNNATGCAGIIRLAVDAQIAQRNNRYAFYLADAEKDDCFIVTIVERWANEHPAVTRKSKMLEIFPDATTSSNGAVRICPKQLEANYECQGDCDECEKEYWETEI